MNHNAALLLSNTLIYTWCFITSSAFVIFVLGFIITQVMKRSKPHKFCYEQTVQSIKQSKENPKIFHVRTNPCDKSNSHVFEIDLDNIVVSDSESNEYLFVSDLTDFNGNYENYKTKFFIYPIYAYPTSENVKVEYYTHESIIIDNKYCLYIPEDLFRTIIERRLDPESVSEIMYEKIDVVENFAL